MRHPSSVVAIVCLPFLVRPHFCKGFFVCTRIILYWDLRRHSAHREHIPTVTGLDTQKRIRMHEMGHHRHERPISEEEIAFVSELLNAREDVIPTPTV